MTSDRTIHSICPTSIWIHTLTSATVPHRLQPSTGRIGRLECALLIPCHKKGKCRFLCNFQRQLLITLPHDSYRLQTEATVPARHLGPLSHSTVSQQRPGGEVKWSYLVLSLDRSSHEDQIVLTTHLKHFPPPPPHEPTAPPTQTSTPTTPRSPRCVQGETARRPAPPRVRAGTAAPHEARKVS